MKVMGNLWILAVKAAVIMMLTGYESHQWKLHIGWKMVACIVMMVKLMHLQAFLYSSIWRGIHHMVENR